MQRSPFFTYSVFRPFCLQPPHNPRPSLSIVLLAPALIGHPAEPEPAVLTLQPSAWPVIRGFALRSQARRVAGPNRVRQPADWSFASRYSPPRLAATQLRSASEVKTPFRSGLTPLGRGTLEGVRAQAARRQLAPPARRQITPQAPLVKSRTFPHFRPLKGSDLSKQAPAILGWLLTQAPVPMLGLGGGGASHSH